VKIIVVAGARPNFMKVAPILAALHADPARFTPLLVHTGQHYDYQMSDIFFTELGLPAPDRFLQAASGSAVTQIADILTKFETVLAAERPDLVVVVGDVNSTVACALAANKLEVPVAHVEAGLRSGDRRMPEEVNRIITDGIADLLFTYCEDADANLRAEAVPAACIHRVGNVMIDSLLRCRPRAAAVPILDELGVQPGAYGLVTLHRPSNVDDPVVLGGILTALTAIQQDLELLFLAHPRTRKNLARMGLESQLEQLPGLRLLEPVGYLEMLRLQEQARLVLTDSGGVQEETTVLGVPCLTLRENTERPVTLTHGTNVLVGVAPAAIIAAARRALDTPPSPPAPPPLWDGHAAERLVAVLADGVARR
jgi:UDP-N-acetylglucosamine 2-epimerase (non-hydrolysing)